MAISSGAMLTPCSHFRPRRIYLGICWLPSIVYYLAQGGREGYTLGLCATFMLMYIYRQGSQSYLARPATPTNHLPGAPG